MGPERRQALLRNGLPLVLLAILGAIILGITDRLTRPHIESNREMQALATVREVMPLQYDNDLLHDRLAVSDPLAGGGKSTTVFRARRKGEPLGIVLLPVTAHGYNGPIELAVGIAFDGTLTGVRVVAQSETEGLGDKVDQHKSDWIFQFEGHSLDNTLESAWAVHSDGGAFDQLSGATITPRGVIEAVKSSLDYYRRNRELLWK